MSAGNRQDKIRVSPCKSVLVAGAEDKVSTLCPRHSQKGFVLDDYWLGLRQKETNVSTTWKPSYHYPCKSLQNNVLSLMGLTYGSGNRHSIQLSYGRKIHLSLNITTRF